MRSFTPTDDKQLWKVSEPADGFAWPIYVTPAKDSVGDCYFVELALPVETNQQWRFVRDRLGKYAFESDGPKWLIRQSAFEKSPEFNKCKGVTPRYYLKWGISPNGETVKSGENPDKSVGIGCGQMSGKMSESTVKESLTAQSPTDDFVRYFCAQEGITDLNRVRLTFWLMCKWALPWMLEQGKPLDLKFCTIYALPLRKNWQAVLHAMWPNILATFKLRRHRNHALEAMGFMESLHSTDLIEIPEGNRFGWCLNIVEGKPFEKTVAKLETETLENSPTPLKYVMRLSAQIGKRYGQILDCFGAWLSKASLPVAYLDRPVEKHLTRLAARKSRGRVRPSPARPPATYQTTLEHSPHPEKAPNVAAEEAAEDLPKVSDV